MMKTNVSALALATLLAAGTTAAFAQTTTEEDADQTEGDQATGDAAARPADGAEPAAEGEVVETVPMEEAEPAAEEGTVVVEEEPAEDTVIVTEPETTEAPATEGEVVVVDEAEPAEDGALIVDDAEPVEGEAVVVEDAEAVEPVEPVEGQIFEQSADQILGSTLLDATVVSTDGETIGDVDDMVVSSEGQITGVVIGVGGFLGIGEKRVAVEFARIEVRQQEGGELRFVLDATQEQLEAAPEFQTRDALDAAVVPATDGAVATDGDVAIQNDSAVEGGAVEPAETVIKPAD